MMILFAIELPNGERGSSEILSEEIEMRESGAIRRVSVPSIIPYSEGKEKWFSEFFSEEIKEKSARLPLSLSYAGSRAVVIIQIVGGNRPR